MPLRRSECYDLSRMMIKTGEGVNRQIVRCFTKVILINRDNNTVMIVGAALLSTLQTRNQRDPEK